MRQHLEIIDFNEGRIIHISNAMKNIFDQLKIEDKFLGIIYKENDLNVIETKDFFNVNMYEIINQRLTIIIDRNLFIAARELYDNRCLKTERHSFFALLLIYAIFTNAIFDPTIPTYEGGNSDKIKAIDDILKFRIIDNLQIDTIMDLSHGKIEFISEIDLQEAKLKMRPINKVAVEEDYNKKLTLFKRNYPYMLKATLLLRSSGLNLHHRVKYFFEWMMKEYITNSAAITFVLFSFYKNGGVIKDYRTNDYNKLISSIKNATWDVTLVSYLKDQAKKNVNRYYLLSSMDKNLLEATNYFLSSDELKINELFGNKTKDIRKIIDNANEICRAPDREKIILNRLDKVDSLINSLEKEIKQNLS